MVSKINIEPAKLFQYVLIGFVAVQAVSWILSTYFPTAPLLRGGSVFYLFLLVIIISAIYSTGTNLKSINIKRDIPLLLLVMALVLLLYLFLPEIIPEIFSSSAMEFKELLRQNLGSIASIGTGVANFILIKLNKALQ